MDNDNNYNCSFKSFNRNFFDSQEDFTIIGSGEIGGKAKGLAFIKKFLNSNFPDNIFKGIEISIPRLTVITTEFFDKFMEQNALYEVAYSDSSDTVKANKFMHSGLPPDLTGDLRSLISNIHSPLAIRSSSLLEDALYEPFAGIYATKMISNNQFEEDSRFLKLIEAIKFVYASTFFKKAMDYIKASNKDIREEKMSVIIQEVVGNKYENEFYPDISGVARSYNYYAFGKSNPSDGVVNLALGLGKTIVDGEISWAYSPAYPSHSLPYASMQSLIDNTQRNFWSVNMSKHYLYNPVSEAEYLKKKDINEAEKDGTLDLTASTFDNASNMVRPGLNIKGPRVLNFNPILDIKFIPLNDLIKKLLNVCEEAMQSSVEVEFAVTLKKNGKLNPRFGFLQVRPMVVDNEIVEISDDEKNTNKIFIKSDRVLGNGTINDITSIVYVKPENFDIANSEKIASEIEMINLQFINENKKYLLLGYGRWGSTDKWLGIPVEWGQISNAKVIIEAMLPSINVELSQGSHFFHNINSFRVLYFSLNERAVKEIPFDWLSQQQIVQELNYIKHIKLEKPLLIKVDGREAKGIIIK